MSDAKPSSSKRIEELRKLIEDIEVAMFTTRRPDGRLVSRPMATQAPSSGADFWFVTDTSTHKLDELEADPHVNLAYYNTKSREYVSVSGIARVVNDRSKVEELYRPDWKAWFPGDDEVSGTPADPRITLIAVDADSATYLKIDKPRPVVLFEVMKGMVTGDTPDIGETQRVSKADLQKVRR
jgi:general stress protein 26